MVYLFYLTWLLDFDCVAEPERLPAHFAYPKHERRRKEEGDVCHDCHQGYRQTLLQPHPQDRSSRPQQEVCD